MIKKEAFSDEMHANQEERQIYDEGITMFLEIINQLKKQYPNVAVENLVTQLARAFSETQAIILLRETNK